MTKKRSIYQDKSTSESANGSQISCKAILSFICFISLVFCDSFETIAIAHGDKNEIDHSILFQPPPGEEKPEDTEGGGSRGDQIGACGRDTIESMHSDTGDRNILTAIVPDGYNGLTTAERPTFWVNLPSTSAAKAILLIKKGSNSDWHQSVTHSQQSVNLVRKAGIVGIKLSEAAPTLEVGESYRWVLTLVCGNQPNPNDPLITAGIKRVDRSQFSRDVLTASTELDRASLYAREGIWYDALDTLIAEQSSLNNWSDIWLRYLRSGGLAEEIAHKPIVGQLDKR